MNFKKQIANFINWYQFRKLKPSKKSRQVLRNQPLVVNGKSIKAMDYIDKEAAKLPIIRQDKKIVDHKHRARQFYLKYDVEGANYYFAAMYRTFKYMQHA